MKKQKCMTCFVVLFKFDYEKEFELSKSQQKYKPEEIGILNKEEVSKYIENVFGINPKWNKYYFVLNINKNYDSDISKMIRVTLNNLIGKERKIKEMCKKFNVSTSLVMKPSIAHKSVEPKQILELDSDIIDFLYKSNTTMDLNYSIV